MKKEKLETLFKIFGQELRRASIFENNRFFIEKNVENIIEDVENLPITMIPALKTTKTSGLGLSVSQKLCNQMKGTIRVKSEEKKGSKFWFSFILSNSEVEQNRKKYSVQTPIQHHRMSPDRKSNALYASFDSNSLKDYKFQYSTKEEPCTKLVRSEEIKEQLRQAKPEQDSFSRNNKTTQRLCTDDDLLIVPDEHITTFEDFLKLRLQKYSFVKCFPKLLLPRNKCNCARILIVDDNKINRVILSKALEKLRLQSLEASNGLDCVDQIRTYNQEKVCCGGFKLVLMDLQMPVMDGIEATGEIKKMVLSGAIKNVSVVAVTAYAAQTEREKCQRAGMDGFLTKPISEPKLKKYVTQILGIRF